MTERRICHCPDRYRVVYADWYRRSRSRLRTCFLDATGNQLGDGWDSIRSIAGINGKREAQRKHTLNPRGLAPHALTGDGSGAGVLGPLQTCVIT